jgi:HEPN domain-containing protein/predicted nucleotidyltransferase
MSERFGAYMLKTLDDAVQRIVQGYDPDRIILFGSRATGGADEGSDFDLLIVKDTDRRPIDRRVAVERLLADRTIPLDILVYTPREMWDLYSAGSPLMATILETGRVLFMRKATAAWLAEAREELEIARILLDHRKHRGVCLHSQQGTEKALKALLFEKGRQPARTHDVIELLTHVRAEGYEVSLSLDDAAFLTSVYRGRYPTEEGLLPHGEPTTEDARRAYDASVQALRSIERVVA